MNFAHLALDFLRDNGYKSAHISNGWNIDGEAVQAVQIGIKSPYIVCFMLSPATQIIHVRSLNTDAYDPYTIPRTNTVELCSITDPTALDQMLKKVKEVQLIL